MAVILKRLNRNQELALDWLTAIMESGKAAHFQNLLEPDKPNLAVARIDNIWVVLDMNQVDPLDII